MQYVLSNSLQLWLLSGFNGFEGFNQTVQIAKIFILIKFTQTTVHMYTVQHDCVRENVQTKPIVFWHIFFHTNVQILRTISTFIEFDWWSELMDNIYWKL